MISKEEAVRIAKSRIDPQGTLPESFVEFLAVSETLGGGSSIAGEWRVVFDLGDSGIEPDFCVVYIDPCTGTVRVPPVM